MKRKANSGCFAVFRRIAYLSCLILFYPGLAWALTDYTWIGAVNTNWSESGNWSPAGPPNGVGDGAIIDNVPGSQSQVNLDMSSWNGVGGLTVDADDTLIVDNGRILYLRSSATVSNNGTIELSSQGSSTKLEAFSTHATLSGSGEVVLGSNSLNVISTFAPGSITNGGNHTIRGGGTVLGPLTNNGVIRADAPGSTMLIEGVITNSTGELTTGNEKTLQIGSGFENATVNGGNINPGTGTIDLKGGKLSLTTIGSGTVSVSASSTLSGDNTNSGHFTVEDAILYLKNTPTITNNGTLELSSQGSSTKLEAFQTHATLSGSGEVVLGSNSLNVINTFAPGSITNGGNHTIRGGGTVLGPLTNNGVIRADVPGNTLVMEGIITNSTGELTTGNTKTLQIGSGFENATVNGGNINPGTGTIDLKGGKLSQTTIGSGTVSVSANSTLSGNNTNSGHFTVEDAILYLKDTPTITNNGTIELSSQGGTTKLEAFQTHTTLSGSGEVLLGNNSLNVISTFAPGSITNDVNHTIRGGGTIEGTIVNNGTIRADNDGTMRISASVTGGGSVQIGNGTLELQQNLETKDFIMTDLADLRVSSSKTVDLNGEFTFAQTIESLWTWGSGSVLKMSGVGDQEQNLEVGGRNFGAVAAGFTSNFNLPALVLEGSGTSVKLVDLVNNGNRTSPEALYVDTLTVNSGTTLNLNGLNLYTYHGSPSAPVQVVGGDNRFGAGTILSLNPGTYYVDMGNGSDTSNGSSDTPWKTLHHAISQINNGASGTYILIMAAGTYSIGNGEADAAITLSQSNVTILGADDHTIGANNTTTTIDGTGAATWTNAIKITGSNVVIRGLSITKFLATGGYGIEISGGTENEVGNSKIFNNDTGIEIANSSNFKIRNCEIYSNTTDGLNVYLSTGGEIYGNAIYGHQGSGDEGIKVDGSSPAISRNKVYDNTFNISVTASASETASPTIKNNVIYETTADDDVHYGIYIGGNSGSTVNPQIYHNTINGGLYVGILIEGETDAPIIKYNIVTYFRQYGIQNGDTGVQPTLDYNDVWHNGAASPFENNYDGFEVVGDHAISQDPRYGSFTLQSDSPCIDVIPTGDPPNDPITMDYPGYARPKGSGFDMGAYEYIASQTYAGTFSGSTGVETDYRIFTIPLDIGTGLDMRNTMEGTLGSYDPTHWRVFARTVSGDMEMNTQAFASLDIKPGMGFWGLTLYTSAINFQGTLSPDAIYYKMALAPGWHLFAVPWPNKNIELGKIYVSDGVNQYPITDASNTLTQKYIWDYTGTGSTGYTVRSTSGFSLSEGTGFFIKVLGSSNIILAIPPNNTSNPPGNNAAFVSPAMGYEFPESVLLSEGPEPPPLPGGSYGPVPDIKANGKSGPVTVINGTPVSITVSLDPGDEIGANADWWIVAHTPFASPLDWYSYVYPEGWRPGIYPCVQTPLFQVPPSFEVLDMVLPAGDYKFYFAVDENADGFVDETWVDSVELRVE